MTQSSAWYPIGTGLGLRTWSILRFERQLGTVPQACQTAPSKACRAMQSALTGTRTSGTSMGLQSLHKEDHMRLYTGIDWSESKHDVVFMNEKGAAVAQLTIPHTPDGFLKLDITRVELGVAPT